MGNMTNKENYLNALHHKEYEWIPVKDTSMILAGFESSAFEKGLPGGGYDGFGVRWVTPASGGSTAIPAPNEFVLDDITKWKKIQFPDLKSYDWENERDMTFKTTNFNRDTMVLEYGSGNGHFERLVDLMGHENALISLVAAPDAVNDFFEALTDYKIEVAKYAKKYYDPDTFVLYDDVATQISTFMSPDCYKKLISPHHKRLATEVKNLGIDPLLHCCGKADSLVPYFIEEGWLAWTSVQPINDIPGVLQKYGDKICLVGGYDTTGKPGQIFDDAIIFAEIERCFREYGPYRSYIFAGFIIIVTENPEETWVPTGMLCDKAYHYSREHSKEYLR